MQSHSQERIQHSHCTFSVSKVTTETRKKARSVVVFIFQLIFVGFRYLVVPYKLFVTFRKFKTSL